MSELLNEFEEYSLEDLNKLNGICDDFELKNDVANTIVKIINGDGFIEDELKTLFKRVAMAVEKSIDVKITDEIEKTKLKNIIVKFQAFFEKNI